MDLPEIVDGNFWVLTDNFVLVVDISRGKVDQDVDYEHYVNWKCKISQDDLCFLMKNTENHYTIDALA